MIITRSPLRITLGGGGTDLPSYYSKFGGFLIAAAIDKYVYITLHKTFIDDMIIKYSRMEKVDAIKNIKHPIIREALGMTNTNIKALEMTSMADIPAGTGLGSSGSFTTALLKALHTYKRNLIHPKELAEQACEIEIGRLGEPIGKQDQYIASYGGVTCFEFNKNGTVKAYPLRIDKETLYDLEDNLLLFFTGYSRSASSILKEQNDKSKCGNKGMIENLHFVKDIGIESRKALEAGNLKKFGELMNVHWGHKCKRSRGMSNSNINKWYEMALANGALGGKLIGAGGGGFLMFYASDKIKLRHAMMEEGLEEVRFRFDFEGTKSNGATVMPQIVILAGGPATRLYPLTLDIPKSMIKIAGRPFIEHQIYLLKRNGIEKIIICAGYLAEQIMDFVKDGRQFGVSVRYSVEKGKLLGTGGALKKAMPILDDIFFVMYGDSYLTADFKPIISRFISNAKKGLMTVFKNDNKWDKSNVVYQNGKIIKYDKTNPTDGMEYIDYGLSILRKDVFNAPYANETFDLADIYKGLIGDDEMLGYEVKERFFEIGSFEGLKETESCLEKMVNSPGKA